MKESIGARSVYNQDAPDDVIREGALEDYSLRQALINVREKVVRKVKAQRGVKSLIQGHRRQI